MEEYISYTPRTLSELSDEEFISVLNDYRGSIGLVTGHLNDLFGSGFTTYGEVWDRSKKFDKQKFFIEQGLLDIAEHRLQQLMMSNDDRIAIKATIFYLERKGKERGWSREDTIKHIAENTSIGTIFLGSPAGYEEE